MRAMVMHETGSPQVLKLEDLPEPSPGPDSVCIQVAACSLNRLDLWVRQGIPGMKLQFPHILGSDVAGTVHSLGEGVSGLCQIWFGCNRKSTSDVEFANKASAARDGFG